MDTVSQKLFKAFVIQPQMNCEYICNEIQKLIEEYRKINQNLDNVVMTLTMHNIIDADSQPSSVPLITSNK